MINRSDGKAVSINVFDRKGVKKTKKKTVFDRSNKNYLIEKE